MSPRAASTGWSGAASLVRRLWFGGLADLPVGLIVSSVAAACGLWWSWAAVFSVSSTRGPLPALPGWSGAT